MRRNKDLFDHGRRRPWGCLVLLALLMLLVLAGVFLNLALNAHPGKVAEKVFVPGLPKEAGGLRILHISDLHGRMFGDGQQQIMKLLNDENYHAVCMTGDLLGPNGETGALLALIRQLPRDLPILIVPGDEDADTVLSSPNGGTSPLSPWVEQAVKAGAVYLDAPKKLAFGKSTIWFCPADLLTADFDTTARALADRKKAILAAPDAASEENGARLRAIEYRLDVLARTVAARQEMLPKDVYIALSHAPLGEASLAFIHTAAEGVVRMNNFPGRLSLILSGHLNNGQVRLPGLGAVYVPATEWTGQGGLLPDSRLLSGVQSVRGVVQYITPGLGVSRTYPWWARLRLMNKPEISLLTLIGDR